MTEEFMAKRTLYPPIAARQSMMKTLRVYVFRCFCAAFLVCAVVNLSVGGSAWSLYVLISEYIFFTAFLTKEQVEATLPQKLMTLTFSICVLLMLVEWLSAGTSHTMKIAVPMTYFGALFVNSVIYFTNFKKQHKNVLPLLQMIFAAIVAVVIGIFDTYGMNWARIVLLSYSVALIGVSLLWFRKPVICELWKKFYTT